MRPEHRTTIEVVGERFERRPSEEVGKVREDSGKLREEFAAEMGIPRIDVHDPPANLRMGSDTVSVAVRKALSRSAWALTSREDSSSQTRRRARPLSVALVLAP
jgi:hypothetical protein